MYGQGSGASGVVEELDIAWGSALVTAGEMLGLMLVGIGVFAILFAWFTSHPMPWPVAATASAVYAAGVALFRLLAALAMGVPRVTSAVMRWVDWLGPLAAAG